jgi:hypothetical protein
MRQKGVTSLHATFHLNAGYFYIGQKNVGSLKTLIFKLNS